MGFFLRLALLGTTATPFFYHQLLSFLSRECNHILELEQCNSMPFFYASSLSAFPSIPPATPDRAASFCPLYFSCRLGLGDTFTQAIKNPRMRVVREAVAGPPSFCQLGAGSGDHLRLASCHSGNSYPQEASPINPANTTSRKSSRTLSFSTLSSLLFSGFMFSVFILPLHFRLIAKLALFPKRTCEVSVKFL